MTQERFRTFLLSISGEIEQDKLEQLKFLCSKEHIPSGELAAINKPYELFEALISKGKLSKDDTSILQDLLTSVGDIALSTRVKDFMLESQDCTNFCYVMNDLPRKVANFIGREELVNDIYNLLAVQDKQVVVLLGPPGYGKSTVVTHVGHALNERPALHERPDVIFVSLRKITSMNCLGTEILRSIDPQYSLSDDVLLQAKNYLVRSVKKPTVLILDNSEDIQNSADACYEFEEFIECVASKAKNVKILIGTRSNLIYHESETIPLTPLDESSSVSLLCYFASMNKDSSDAKELGIQCKGIPLLIKIAGRRVKNGYNASKLAEDLKTRPYSVLKFKGDQVQDYLTNSIRVFLDSLDREMLLSLVHVSNFAAEFTAEDVCKVFPNIDPIDWRNMLCLLRENALLQLEGERYSIHPLLQTFCREEQERMKCVKEGSKSTEVFTSHYLNELEDIHKEFVSKTFQHALQRYDSKRMNLEQSRENAIKLGTTELKLRCIDAFNSSINLLGKIMQPSHCFKVYQELYDEADKLKDKRRMSECLISMGFKHLCEVGHNRFSSEGFECLVTAVYLQKSLSNKRTEAYAHCQSKLGLFYIANPDSNPDEKEKGKQLMEDALRIRNELDDKVLVTASYCDKALADGLSGEHAKAITKLKEHCYPEYKNYLGDDHPWVASVIDYIANSYKVLGELDEAVKYNTMSLSIREKTLGRHQDTARSYAHLAELLYKQDNLKGALDNYRQALSIQEEVLGIHEETKTSIEAIRDILGKLGMDAEKDEMKRRADSFARELEQHQTLQKQISQEIQERALLQAPLG